MMGTLAMFMANSKISTIEKYFKAEVTGDIENVDGVLKITKIHAHYHLTAPEEKWDEARQALEMYLAFCPGAQSVIGCIEISHELTLDKPA